jgi:hypothetical protein
MGIECMVQCSCIIGDRSGGGAKAQGNALLERATSEPEEVSTDPLSHKITAGVDDTKTSIMDPAEDDEEGTEPSWRS